MIRIKNSISTIGGGRKGIKSSATTKPKHQLNAVWTSKKGIGKPKKTSLNESEHEIQSKFVKWFREEYPDLIVFSVPNGTLTSIGIAKKMVREGALKGVPDLFIPHPHGYYHGFFIEFKSKTGILRQEQKDIINILESEGYKVAVCRSFEDAKNLVERYIRE